MRDNNNYSLSNNDYSRELIEEKSSQLTSDSESNNGNEIVLEN